MMSNEKKTYVFIFVALAVGFLLLRPYLWPSGDEEFAAASSPQAAIDKALEERKPVFLEFYSDT